MKVEHRDRDGNVILTEHRLGLRDLFYVMFLCNIFWQGFFWGRMTGKDQVRNELQPAVDEWRALAIEACDKRDEALAGWKWANAISINAQRQLAGQPLEPVVNPFEHPKPALPPGTATRED